MMMEIHKKRTLQGWSKAELIEHCECLEHNNKVLRESFEIQYSNCMKIVEDMSLLNERFKGRNSVTRNTNKG